MVLHLVNPLGSRQSEGKGMDLALNVPFRRCRDIFLRFSPLLQSDP